MEAYADQLAVCLPSHQPNVCIGFSFGERFASTVKNVCIYFNTCPFNGNMYSFTSQEILEVDL
jgi:hypothetical protein